MIGLTAGAAMLTGCALTGPTEVEHDFCANTSYIYIEQTDVIAESTARQILMHNETRKEFC